MRLSLLFIPAALLVLGADDAGSEAKKLQGTWNVVTFEVDGKKQPTEEERKMMQVIFKDGTMTLQAGKKKETGTFTLAPTKKPKEMDLVVKVGKQTALFIYEVDGDNLKLCWRKPENPRPTEFTAKDTAGLMVLKREKKE